MKAKSISRPRRSILFFSALGKGALKGAIKSGADIICVDLEDAVPPGRKADGRVAARKALQEGPCDAEAQIAVRINSLRSRDGIADILACLELWQSRVGALVLPKVESGDEVRWAAALLDETNSHLELYVIVETNEGLENCREIAKSHSRVKALFFGGFDLWPGNRCYTRAPAWCTPRQAQASKLSIRLFLMWTI